MTAVIQDLKTAYANIDRLDPESEEFHRTKQLLEALSDEDLEMIINARVKFISLLAVNIRTRRKFESQN